MRRSPFLALVPAATALVASLARWLIQGSGNLYTTLGKRFYVPDPDLGWRIAGAKPIWLGLEVLGIVTAVAVAVAVAAWVIRRVERKRQRPWRWARWASWAVACVPLVVPIAAFATGLGPAERREVIPVATGTQPTSGIAGRLALPEGSYAVATGSSVTARIEAGGETFDARFTGDVRGSWRGNPGALSTAVTAEVSVATASVDTGIELRSEHARGKYLHADQFPRIGFSLGPVIAASQDAADRVGFRAGGTISLMGTQQPVEVTGTMHALDAEAVARLGLSRSIPTFVILADTALRISQTPLATHAASFDTDSILIHVSLVLARTQTE